MSKIPQAVLDDLQNDSDFLSLPDSEQNQYLDKIGASFGEVPKTEGLLGSIAKIASQAGQEAYGQANQFAQGFDSEATLNFPEVIAHFGGPNIMTEPQSTVQKVARGAGRVAGFAFGIPEHVGAMAAKTFANPFIKGAARGAGSMASFIPSDIARGEATPQGEALKVGGGAAFSGLTEGGSDLLFKSFFGKNIGKAEIDSLGKDLNKIKETIKKNPNTQVDVTNLWTKLSDIYDSAAPPVQAKLGEMKKWIDTLEKSGGTVHADIIRQMEEELGASAKFMGQKSGFMDWIRGKPSSPTANKAMQQGRTAASDEYNSIANKQGYPEFETKSKQLSSKLKKYPDDNPAKVAKDFGLKVGAAILGTKFLGPIGGIGGYLLEKAAQDPNLKEQAFKLLSSPEAAKLAQVGGKIGRSVSGNILQEVASRNK